MTTLKYTPLTIDMYVNPSSYFTLRLMTMAHKYNPFGFATDDVEQENICIRRRILDKMMSLLIAPDLVEKVKSNSLFQDEYDAYEQCMSALFQLHEELSVTVVEDPGFDEGWIVSKESTVVKEAIFSLDRILYYVSRIQVHG